jgi:hypothetical protein
MKIFIYSASIAALYADIGKIIFKMIENQIKIIVSKVDMAGVTGLESPFLA